ncbi:MAG: anthranilate phosphoribosyltransferase [Desulfovibrionaceae bacterium]
MTIPMSVILETLARGEDLAPEQAEEAFGALMQGELSPAQAGALLMGLRAKGEKPAEVAAAVRATLRHSRMVPGLSGTRIDTVGTGGDNTSSFNCSTTTALYLAAMGHTVVKHGNRALSSTCGSADAVEGLGLPLGLEPGEVAAELAARNFVFLFAPNYHPAFKHVMPIRRELGVRTLFNIMGPLLNPARPTHLLVGSAMPQLLDLMAEVLLLGGVTRAAVIHGARGFDELTPFGTSEVVWVRNGTTERGEIDPLALGIKPCEPKDVAVRDKEEAVAVLRELLCGKGPRAMREMLALNLGMCLFILEQAPDLTGAVALARDAVASGAAERFAHLDAPTGA